MLLTPLSPRSAATVFSAALLALMLTGASARDAQANCAAPVSYYQQKRDVPAGAVVVCPDNFSGRRCGDAEVMLREDVKTGAVVQLGAVCAGERGCYLDECVPAGTYRYGFARPYQCASSSCGTYFFTEVTVAPGDVPASCARTTTKDRAPVAFSGAKPWKTTAKICGYGGGPKTGCATASGPASDARVSPAALFVLLVQGALVALGAAWMRRKP